MFWHHLHQRLAYHEWCFSRGITSQVKLCTIFSVRENHNRLVKITYPGTNNFTEFTYDGLGRNVKIVETESGSVTSTKQFVWCGTRNCEERNGSGSVTKMYFDRGQSISSASYCYALDHRGSVRELTDSSGVLQVQYGYQPYGQTATIQGTLSSDFQFSLYYRHERSGLYTTVFRDYLPSIARWLSRDPLGEEVDPNQYAFVGNNPLTIFDPLGLQGGLHQGNWVGQGWTSGAWIGEDHPQMPMLPGDYGPKGEPFRPPIDAHDKCGYIHDLCMHIGHSIGGSPEELQKQVCWNRDCHCEAADCFKRAGAWFKARVFKALCKSKRLKPGTYRPDPRFSSPPGAPIPGPTGPLRDLPSG